MMANGCREEDPRRPARSQAPGRRRGGGPVEEGRRPRDGVTESKAPAGTLPQGEATSPSQPPGLQTPPVLRGLSLPFSAASLQLHWRRF